MKDIWDLWKDDKVSRSDKIVLGTTFDNVIVKKENLPELITAFREFESPTSLKEQAGIIKGCLKEQILGIGWNQTSVNADTWTTIGGQTRSGECKPYNLLKMDDHWFLFDNLS